MLSFWVLWFYSLDGFDGGIDFSEDNNRLSLQSVKMFS